MFCSAAPIAAIVSFAVLGHLPALSDPRAVALCVLFSGGTVLHAGLVHVLPSVIPPHSQSLSSSPSTGGGTDPHHELRSSQGGRLFAEEDSRPSGRHPKPASGSVVAVLIASSLLPLVISALVPE